MARTKLRDTEATPEAERTPLLRSNYCSQQAVREDSANSGLTATATANHKEDHANYGEYIKHAVIGFADGLTVPFALTAGVSAIGERRFVILSGLAELLAGMISMGLGAWLGSALDAEKYDVEHRREMQEVIDVPEVEEQEIRDIMARYRVAPEFVELLLEGFKKDPEAWVQFMMDFEVKADKPVPFTAIVCALVMGIAYLMGGLIPLIPYFCTQDLRAGLYASIIVTMITLLAFGYGRAMAEGVKGRSAIQHAAWTFVVGVAAAGTSYGIVLGINKHLGG